MKADDNRSLIARHLLGGLKPEETETLMQRALEDPALFEELLSIEDVRNAFQDPAFRARVQADLRARVGERKPSWTEWFMRGRVLTAGITGAALVAILLAIVFLQPDRETGMANLRIELGEGPEPGMRAATLSSPRPEEPGRLDLPPGAPRPPASQASLAFDRQSEVPVYRPGDQMRMGFQLSSNAAAIVVEELPDGSSQRLFPNRFQSSPEVTANTLILIPPAGQGPLTIEGAPGARTVRLMIFPAGTDPLDFRVPWETTRQAAQVVTRQYRVAAQR
jgi:hypothetical protein